MTSFTPDIARIHDSALRSISRVVRETARPTPPDEALSATADALRRGGALVLTGAGVSTDSGIPDYRGPAGSLTRGRPMTYQEFRHDPGALHRYWARSFIGWRHMAGARPNRTHHTLVELERAGLITGIITQNVDGLHAAAGSRTVIGLHGDLSVVICLRCGTREPRHELDRRLDAANPGYLERALAAGAGNVRPDGDIDLPPTSSRASGSSAASPAAPHSSNPTSSTSANPFPPVGGTPSAGSSATHAPSSSWAVHLPS